MMRFLTYDRIMNMMILAVLGTMFALSEGFCQGMVLLGIIMSIFVLPKPIHVRTRKGLMIRGTAIGTIMAILLTLRARTVSADDIINIYSMLPIILGLVIGFCFGIAMGNNPENHDCGQDEADKEGDAKSRNG